MSPLVEGLGGAPSAGAAPLGAGCRVLGAGSPLAGTQNRLGLISAPTHVPSPGPVPRVRQAWVSPGGGKLRQGVELVGLGLLTSGGQGAAPHGTPGLRRGEIGVSEAALGAERCGERSRMWPPLGMELGTQGRS